MSYGNGTLQKNAYSIKAKVIDSNKYLDGSLRFSVLIETYESGNKVRQIVDIHRTCLGHYVVDQGVS